MQNLVGRINRYDSTLASMGYSLVMTSNDAARIVGKDPITSETSVIEIHDDKIDYFGIPPKEICQLIDRCR
jgi:shikimate kinase